VAPTINARSWNTTTDRFCFDRSPERLAFLQGVDSGNVDLVLGRRYPEDYTRGRTDLRQLQSLRRVVIFTGNQRRSAASDQSATKPNEASSNLG